MFSFTLDENRAHYQIRAYKPGIIQVNEKILTQSIILSAHQLIEHWQPEIISELKSSHLAQAATLNPSILIIGTGSVLQFPPLEIYGNLINQGIGIEIMDTAAACRTFTALTSENRLVVAALLLK